MTQLSSLFLTAVLALASSVQAQCGAGSPHATVSGSGSSFRTTRGSTQLYSGSDYRAAIQAGLDGISSGQRVAVLASGSIGAGTITLASGKIFEGCGTINVGNRAGRGAIEIQNVNDVQIPFLTMTGNPYFGLRVSGTRNLKLGRLNFNLSGGLAIRFDRDAAMNYNVEMDTITVTGAGSHAVETWNIDGLKINSVIARNVGESGLLLQNTRNAWVGLVDGDNVATGTGYATFRMANENGKNANGNYNTNVYIDKVVSRGGGRGIFCVSRSGGVVIQSVDLSNNGNNAILIENCYNVSIRGGTVNGGGEVRLSARSEFPNNKDIWITLQVNNNSVRESPCGENTNFSITGNARQQIC
ncbi:hypothetical protein QBC40DRAFT_306272 [Triangularia verruculosa]|uniref:Uncharacterized protein n=1 Tax=Triangularia verruculosa TaxID=2587418 RepID=A0AAN7AXJ4_9PEZI|nr:hypothetical protein QBC40DRAFT_306272 [Triangularia verruculosa]